MIHLIAQRGSNKFESVRKYLRIKRFYDFQEYINYLDNYHSFEPVQPLTIITEEKIDGYSIYNLLAQSNYQSKMKLIPLFVIKNNLEGFERNYVQNRMISDYIPDDANIDDLIERIRFFLMYQRDIGKDIKDDTAGQSRISDVRLMIRRTLDFSFSLLLTILLFPLFLIIAILIKIESSGPVFYISQRAGKGYKIFKIFKFRTMVNKADKMLDEYRDLNQYDKNSSEKNSAFVKLDNDPRITKIGNFLRKTSIDELPQLFNVIKGDMSIIGNRPLPLYEAMKLTRDRQALRFNAPAGITGLWQIRKRGKSEMSADERINLDVEYAKNYSLLTDIKIFFMTFPALIQDTSV